MNRKDLEIMAPVGSRESLAAALQAGADAIYFGVEGLNMRSRSSANFTLDDLREIAATCSAKGVKTYLTVNTVMYDDDIPLMQKIIDTAHQAGITAIIASDIAAIQYAHTIGIEVHISTQLNITNTPALQFYSRWADVAVLARELNLDQVSRISQQIRQQNIRGPKGQPIRLEMFCHGALCMATSGKCYLSLHTLDSSANRGACTQICRRTYRLTDIETGNEIQVDNQYLMSPKDLKTIHFLNKMVQAGITVFKIEGRARGPEYVHETVTCYDQALRAICDGTYTQDKIREWDTRLARVFNRGFWDGYYLGQRLGEWTHKHGSSATRVKQYAAKAIRYYSNLSVAEFRLETDTLTLGQEIIITGPTTGAVILTPQEIRVDLKTVQQVRKGQHFSIPVPAKIRPSDRLYIWHPTDHSNPSENK